MFIFNRLLLSHINNSSETLNIIHSHSIIRGHYIRKGRRPMDIYRL